MELLKTGNILCVSPKMFWLQPTVGLISCFDLIVPLPPSPPTYHRCQEWKFTVLPPPGVPQMTCGQHVSVTHHVERSCCSKKLSGRRRASRHRLTKVWLKRRWHHFDLSPTRPRFASCWRSGWVVCLKGVTNVMTKLLCLISVNVFNFTHCSACLLILSASGFPIPDFPLLASTPFLSSASIYKMTFPFLSHHFHLQPLCIKTTFPFLSEIKSVWALWDLSGMAFIFFRTVDLPCFPLSAAVFLTRTLRKKG